MQLNIESPHIQISEQLQNLIRTKFAHLEKFFYRITACDVILRKEKDERQENYKIESLVLIPKVTFFAREQDENFETALDKVIDNLIRQLKRRKEERKEIW